MPYPPPRRAFVRRTLSRSQLARQAGRRRPPLALRAVFAGPLLLMLASANVPAAKPPIAGSILPQVTPQQAMIAELERHVAEVRFALDHGSAVPGAGSSELTPFRRPIPFFASREPTSYSRATDCLTAAIYYEAASESEAGQRAVAQVVLNRVYHPSWPNSVCGVVFQGSERSTGCQFTFTCDGSLARQPSRAGWDRARRIAVAALNGEVFEGVGDATNYHTIWIRPWWAPTLANLVTIGAHTFYRPRGPGTPVRDIPERETMSFAVMAQRRADPQPLLPAAIPAKERTALAQVEDDDIAAARPAESPAPRKARLSALEMDESQPAEQPTALAAAAEPAAPSAGIRAL